MTLPNEPAFPLYGPAGEATGLTKREYFAGLAMQGLQAHPLTGENTTLWIAATSVEMADALLAELQKAEAPHA